MSSFDNINAPQFSTFDETNDDDLESYFQIDHENELEIEIEEYRRVSDDVFFTPSISNGNGENGKENRSRLRRSISNGNIRTSVQRRVNTLENSRSSSNTDIHGQLNKARSTSQPKLRWASQEHINRLAAPKNSQQKFVSVAEAIRKFEQQPPLRFLSVPKNKQQNPQKPVQAVPRMTIPQSPALATGKRMKSHPNIHIPTFEERERIQFEEEQKNKFKAHPVNKKIFQPLKAIHKEVKKTVPEPFKLTELDKKEPPKEEKYEFHAKPLPKSILEPPKLPEKKPIKITQPVTPKCAKNIQKRPDSVGNIGNSTEKQRPSSLKKTVPKPFSFEDRDKRLIEQKENFIKKFLEEEKKKREFHAKPISKPVISLFSKQKSKSEDLDSTCSSSNQENNNNNEFKAKPALVLQKKPFEPKKIEFVPIPVQPFKLQSEMRAKEREEFERKLREKEERYAKIQRELEEKENRKREEEIRKLRKEIEFKAKPIRVFKELPVKAVAPVTEPISPVFKSGKSNINRENDKENVEQ